MIKVLDKVNMHLSLEAHIDIKHLYVCFCSCTNVKPCKTEEWNHVSSSPNGGCAGLSAAEPKKEAEVNYTSQPDSK